MSTRLIIVSGLSGSGKSVALNMLEDLDYYCIDNIPVALLGALAQQLVRSDDPMYARTAVGVDARSRPEDIEKLPQLITELQAQQIDCEVLFLYADEDALLRRFNETHRKHPLLTAGISLRDAIARERELLKPIVNIADLTLDTTWLSVYELRDAIRERVVASQESGQLSIVVESFGYKHGLPADADIVFDVRCLLNPYWEPQLRHLSGKDPAVAAFLEGQPATAQMIDDVVRFLDTWIPRYNDVRRRYLTIAIGCTGGQHRSVYVAEKIAGGLAEKYSPIIVRHTELPQQG